MRLSRSRVFGLFCCIGMVLVSRTAGAQEQERDIAGFYQVVGEAGGKKYLGVAAIVRAGEAYRVEWQIGRDVFVGQGVRTGNTFAASWAILKNGDVLTGTMLYEIQDGQLNGRWVQLGGRAVCREFMRPIKGLDK